MNKKRLNILFLLFFFIFLLRFYQLDQCPPSLNVDEAAFGYNAYCILKTGKDEFGQKFPLAFKSINDYKAPLTVYLIAFSEKIFGLNQFAVRFPSALLGSLTVILSFFLTKEIFPQKKFKNLPLISTLLFAISPWHIQHSRAGIDASPALFFIVFGSLLFLKAKKIPILFIPSAISFSLSLYAYHSPRVFTPLLILGLIMTSYKFFFKNKKNLLLFLFCFLSLLIPLINTLSGPEARIRMKGVSVFSDSAKIYEPFLNAQIYDQNNNLPFSKVFHNRRIAYALEFIKGYLMHFDPAFFFTSRGFIYTPPYVSLLYLWELPFIFIGLYSLVRNLSLKKSIVFWWLLISPIPAAPTWPIPHPRRVLNLLPIPQILCGIGLLRTVKFFRKKINLQIFKASFSIILIIIFFNFAFYLHQYYIHLPHQQSTAWNFEQKKLISYIKQNQKNFQKIIFFPNPGGSLELIHNFFLFYWPYDPIIYLSQGGTKICEYGMTGRYSFEKFEFRSISCFPGQQRINPTENIPPKAMIIVNASTYSNQKNFPLPIKKIYNEETNEPLIFIYDSNDILKYQSIFPHEPLKN